MSPEECGNLASFSTSAAEQVLRSATAIPFLLMLVHRSGGWPSLFNRGTRWMIGRGLVMFVADPAR